MPLYWTRRRGTTSRSWSNGLGLGTAVGLHVTDGYVDPLVTALAPGIKHGVGLADAGCVAEEDLSGRAVRPPRQSDVFQQLIGIGALVVSGHAAILTAGEKPGLFSKASILQRLRSRNRGRASGC